MNRTSMIRAAAAAAADLAAGLVDLVAELCRAAAAVGEHLDRLVTNLHSPDPQTGRCDWCRRRWPCHDHMQAARRLTAAEGARP